MSRVSVIMSVYKEPILWIKQAIDSILMQTFSDFEFIIVNDNPDRPENEVLLADYKQRDARIRTISNEVNLGLTKSLNKALSVATGELIARMDADDVSLQERFKKQVEFLDSHSTICAVGTWLINIDENGVVKSDIVHYDTDPRWIKAQFLQNSQLCHPSSMFRRIVNGFQVRYDEDLRYAQDYALWVSLLPYGDIANIPEVLLWYRISSKQITIKNKAEQQACAGIVQRRAFDLFSFSATEAFLAFFCAMTIQHRVDCPIEEVSSEFHSFYQDNSLTKENSLAMEIVYSSYLGYFYGQNNGSLFKYLYSVLKNSSRSMLAIGCKLLVHLYKRKRTSNK